MSVPFLSMLTRPTPGTLRYRVRRLALSLGAMFLATASFTVFVHRGIFPLLLVFGPRWLGDAPTSIDLNEAVAFDRGLSRTSDPPGFEEPTVHAEDVPFSILRVAFFRPLAGLPLLLR